MKNSFIFEAEPFETYSEFDEYEEEFDTEFTEEEWQGEVNRSSPDFIRWVQSSLNKIMGLRLAVDGRMGQQTRSAIRSFQQRQGLVADGIVGPKTEERLRVAAGSSASMPVSATCSHKSVDCPPPGKPFDVLDNFAFAKATLNPKLHIPKIINVARHVIASHRAGKPVNSILIAGHTDPVGSDDDNFALGWRRAQEVLRELCQTIERMSPGITRKIKFELTSCGERQQKSTPELSRRVEIFLITESKPGARPSRPLRVEETLNLIKPRKALKSAVNIPIELPLILPTAALPQLKLPLGGPAAGRAVEAGTASGTPAKLLIKGLLGKHTLPPMSDVKAFSPLPRVQLKALQRELRGLSGLLPEHLALLPLPKEVPSELNSKPRINVRLPRERPKDLHEPTTVFLPDERKVFQDTSYPWSTIGRVETPGGICSGVMIGPRHVLTCSHGIQWLPSGAGWVKFTPAYFDAGIPPFGFAYGIKTYYLRKVDGSDGIDREEGQYDYAVVVLNSRLGDLTGYMGTQSWSDDWDNQPYWWHAGYPSDLTSTQRPTFQKGISLDGSFWDREVHTRIFHKGDIFPGQSGGPFFGWWKSELFPRVVAVQSGQSSSENSASGGADMVELVSRARREFP